MREVDGFKLVPTAIQEEPGSRYYRAAVHVTREAPAFDRVHVVYGQGEGFDGLNEEQALVAAAEYVQRVIAVNQHGQLWDRPVT